MILHQARNGIVVLENWKRGGEHRLKRGDGLSGTYDPRQLWEMYLAIKEYDIRTAESQAMMSRQEAFPAQRGRGVLVGTDELDEMFDYDED